MADQPGGLFGYLTGTGKLNLGGAVSDLFGGATDLAGAAAGAAGSYAAGNEYQQAAAITREQTALGLKLATTQIGLTQGVVQATAASSGFQLSGSAQDVMRMNAQQGALSKAAIQQQGLIQESAYTAQQKAANAAAHGQETGGILKSVGAIAAMFL